jgi:hypothetical protein
MLLRSESDSGRYGCVSDVSPQVLGGRRRRLQGLARAPLGLGEQGADLFKRPALAVMLAAQLGDVAGRVGLVGHDGRPPALAVAGVPPRVADGLLLVLALKTGDMPAAHLLDRVTISKLREGQRVATRLVHELPVPIPVHQLANTHDGCGSHAGIIASRRARAGRWYTTVAARAAIVRILYARRRRSVRPPRRSSGHAPSDRLRRDHRTARVPAGARLVRWVWLATILSSLALAGSIVAAPAVWGWWTR